VESPRTPLLVDDYKVSSASETGLMSTMGAGTRSQRSDALRAHGWAHVSLTGDYLWTDAAAASGFRPLNDPADWLYRAV
jgi:hypothetical protein